jgi:hypothetical protein
LQWQLALRLYRDQIAMIFFVAGFVVAIVCAVHAHRTRQDNFWIWIVLIAPWLGSAIYFFAVVLPAALAQRKSAQNPVTPAQKLADARLLLDRAPSVENRLRYGEALLEAGQPGEAAQIFEAELSGEYADDARILNRLAEAQSACGNHAGALAAFERLRASGARLGRETELAYARSLAASGRIDDSVAAFRALLPHYPGEAARGHFAHLLIAQQRMPEARAVLEELVERARHAPAHQIERDGPIYEWARSELATVQKGLHL